jgi:fructose-1,6-bisphosphatase I
MIKGGIYIYPSTSQSPKGKLRLLYECNPMAFIIEQAGGRASDGHTDILDLVAEKLHQRNPLIIGSKEDVQLVKSFIADREKRERDGEG